MTTASDMPGMEGDCAVGTTVPCGEYALENNVWGAEGGPDLTQCVYASPAGAPEAKLGWKWDFPNDQTENVQAYPEVIFGHKPWASGSTTVRLPLLVSPVPSIAVDFSVQTQATGRFNSAFEIWLTKASGGDEGTIATEIMFWIDVQGGARPAGGRDATLTLEPGRSVDLWSATVQGWDYYAFVFQTPFYEGTIDFGVYLKYLLDQGYIDPAHYVADLEFGNEVTHGSGTTLLSRYRVTVGAGMGPGPVPRTPPATDPDDVPPPDSPDADVARILMRVPVDAVVRIEDELMHEGGADRLFTSPPIDPGNDFTYRVSVEWNDGGTPREEVRDVVVRAGETTEVAFFAAADDSA